MKYIISFLFVLAIFISCTTSDKKSKAISKPDDIKADEYVVNTDRDTTIETKNGALLKIPKGALQGDGSIVTLEIKEAYSIEQMIKSGLMTTSNGEPLSSGGMIYINAKGGQEVKITQSIKVALPANYLDKNMQLFKGEKDADGNINWAEPKPLPENKQLSSIDQGKVLFQAQCASCHSIGKDGTGPNLAHFPKRIPYGEAESKYWYHYFRKFYIPYSYDEVTHKADSIYKDRWVDPYACNLINMYGSYGPEFDTTWPVMKSVYDYIQNESDQLNLPLPSHAYLKGCADSCELYESVTKELKYRKTNALDKRNKLLVDSIQTVIKNQIDSAGAFGDEQALSAPSVEYDKKVSPEYSQSTYYQFTIETFGWYNIDVLLKNVDGNKESELMIRMMGTYREKLDIFLIIPSSKIYVRGGPTEKADGQYAFNKKDGTIILPQNAKAYILAMKETNSAIAFAIKEFTTSTRQDLEIELQESTMEVFNNAISVIGTDGIKIDVKESKNADKIRKTDTDIKNIDEQLKDAEKLKPKGCDCYCNSKGGAATVVAADTTIKK